MSVDSYISKIDDEAERNRALIKSMSEAALPAAIRKGLASDPRVSLVCGSSVQIEAVDWLWNGWLAAGKLHLIGGAPGTGKTTIAASLAATVTRGGLWPDGTRAEKGSVVFWSGEDDISDTLAPRLKAAGADMSKVFMIAGVHEDGELLGFDPAHHMSALQDALTAISDVRLIVVDPIISAIAGDSHKNAEVRRGLQPLVDLGMQLHAAVLGVTHLSKGTAGRDPAERITGSIGFVALARVVFVTVRKEAEADEPEQRLFMRTKSNIGPDGDGYFYDLQQGELQGHPGIHASCVVWGNYVEGSGRELMAAAESSGSDDDRDAMVDAIDFLSTVLSMGPRSVPYLKTEAKAAGIAWRTLERAKRKAGVDSRKNGPAGYWEWFRVGNSANNSPSPPLSKLGGVGGVDRGFDGQERQGRQHRQENRGGVYGGVVAGLPSQQPTHLPLSNVTAEAGQDADELVESWELE